MKIPKIITERLCVTIPNVVLAQKVVDYVKENRAFHKEWDPPRSEEYFTLPYWQKTLQEDIVNFKNDDNAKFFIFDKNYDLVIGHCNFSCFVRGAFHCSNLGFSLGEKYQGHGYMFEALTSSIAYIFDKLKLHRIQANHLPHNYRSRSLLHRLGFVVEGYAQNYLYIENRWQDHVLNSLTNTKIVSFHDTEK